MKSGKFALPKSALFLGMILAATLLGTGLSEGQTVAPVTPEQATHSPLHAWDIHPALVHFPIAFLLLAFLVDVRCKLRPSEVLSRSAASLYLLGIGSGALAAVAGAVALFTAPRLVDPGTMAWAHPAAAAAAMALFVIVGISRWRRRFLPPSAGQLSLSLVAVLLLAVAGWLGAGLVYRNGFGVIPGNRGGSEPANPKDAVTQR